MRREVAPEITRRIVKAGDEIGAQPRQHAPLDLGEDRVGEALPERAVPVGRRLAEMRDRRARIETGVPRRRHAGVGRARLVEVEREIAGRGALADSTDERRGGKESVAPVRSRLSRYP